MIAILLKYICICLIFTFIFGLIVLDDTDRWYEFIIKILIMPFIVIGSFIIVIIDDSKINKWNDSFENWRMIMTEDSRKYDAMIKACNISKEELIETGQMKGFAGIYNLGLENMYDYLIKNSEVRKHGSWFLLDECANAGVYCSVCHKKVYKIDYANQRIKSKYCPNCGAIMDLNGE